MFDLLLSLEERGDEIVGSNTYASDLYDRKTMERWMSFFSVLLRDLTDGLRRLVRDLRILPEMERREVVEGFNATGSAYPDQLVQELFEEQVRSRADVSAVVHGERRMSYAELNRRSNQLARYLRNQGIGPDEVVGICVERSLEMVVGLLGILKAGGAYLPLDPNYPTERLQHMLEDAAPRFVLTQREMMGVLPECSAQMIALDETLREIAD